MHKDRLKIDKIWLKVKKGSRSREKSEIIPKDIEKEIASLKQNLLESNLDSIKKRLSESQGEWNKIIAEKDGQINGLKCSLDQKEKEMLNIKKELEEQNLKEIEKIREEYRNMVIKQKEDKLRKDLYEKEINIYQNSADELRDKIVKERNLLQKQKELWEKKEKSLDSFVAQKEEELAQMREELIERENRYYHQQAQTEGELDLLRKELARLRNLLSLEKSNAESTVEQAKENVLSMQQQLEKIHEQLNFHDRLKNIDKTTLAGYADEINKLKKEKAELKENFDQERLRWKDLWEKERNAWSKRKQELREWEDKLRYERERFMKLAWDDKVPVPHFEPSRVQGVGEMPKPPLPFVLRVADKKLWSRNIKLIGEMFYHLFRTIWFYGAVSAALLLFWAASNFMLAVKSPGELFYPSFNPKSVYCHGNDVYMFMNGIQKISIYNKSALEVSHRDFGIPEGVSDFIVNDRFVWTLSGDGSRVSLRTISDPDTIQGNYYLDDKADFIAWDGSSIWSLNTNTQRLSRHSVARKLSVTKRYQLLGINPGSISFRRGKLWVLDRNTRSFVIFKVGNKLKKTGRLALPHFDGKVIVPNDFHLTSDKIWMVNAESSFLYYMTCNRLVWENFWK